uniref:Uncharacterized protein LOC111107637 n=1 Tax=Crassostrea virginica TaxID=6565 RepID=A0A8B8B693_CRAVI|nr:uncharacterized protein LOC111107637 [Crassostrea virginica]XP_022298629.1 uncharacterized protein LOC111107637 [Crassostrea virginica]
MAVQTISESLYVGLCLKIGTPQQVAIRRDVVDIMELLDHKVTSTDYHVRMDSGSRREGFRFQDSDIDIMYWSNYNQVLWDFSESILYNTHRYAQILCDSSESPPGFTLLWLPLEEAEECVLSSCVRINGALYISSAMYRHNTCTLYQPDSTVHGPCSSGIYDGGFEYDYAHCFVSNFWPPSASSWTDRCQSWPPPNVVNDIVRSGCHFVAIGHKLGNHADNEWRISFSQAEQKLVYAMNHTQFLTYGLLKLFVKEFNRGKTEEEKLLCSYHMKTAVFWALQGNTIDHWCPQNLLAGFWVCYKLLLKWVYEGVCPNFFIPENNMFLNKVHGVAQRNLFTQLNGLYEKGIAFLLQNPSISSYILNVLCNPRLSVCTDERTMISEVMLDIELFEEIYLSDAVPSNINLPTCIKYLSVVEQLIRSPIRQCQIPMIQKRTATILQTSAFVLHEMYTNTSGGNKQMYIADKRSCYMLKLAAKFGFVSDLLYIAMYFYKTSRHREALSVIEMTKVKIAQPGLMYKDHVDPERYTEAVGGRSWSYKMRHAVAYNITLYNYICYINELTPEQQSSSLNHRNLLFIPPYILLHMLGFLCCRHVDPMRAQAALDDLQVLVHHDQGVLVDVVLRDISWEILGICQQMTGNRQAALYSYRQSLRQIPYNKIDTATRHRIQDLH